MIVNSRRGPAWLLRIIALFLSCTLILMARSALADFVGQATKVRGDVRVTRDGGDSTVSIGTALQLGDVIKTGPGARLRIRFVDGSIVTFAQSTTVSIDLFAIDATNKSRTVVLTMLEGIVSAAAAKSGESKFDYQIRTGTGYSAVRGTQWIVAALKAAMNVFTISGQVEVGSNAANSKSVLVDAGKWVSVDPTKGPGAIIATTPDVINPMIEATGDGPDSGAPPSGTPTYTPPSTYPNATPNLVPFPVIPPKRGTNNDRGGGYGGGKGDGGTSTN